MINPAPATNTRDRSIELQAIMKSTLESPALAVISAVGDVHLLISNAAALYKAMVEEYDKARNA